MALRQVTLRDGNRSGDQLLPPGDNTNGHMNTPCHMTGSFLYERQNQESQRVR
jgi:hypothetical protein